MKTAVEMSVQEFEDYLRKKRQELYLSPLRKDVGAKWRKTDWGNPTAKLSMQRRKTP